MTNNSNDIKKCVYQSYLKHVFNKEKLLEADELGSFYYLLLNGDAIRLEK
ncbi:MAG: hypothetical protein ACFFD2_08605 [Promethearchaeota archaeon]